MIPAASHLPIQNELSRPRLDSVDQPDSGIEEVVDNNINDTSKEVNVTNSNDTRKEGISIEDAGKEVHVLDSQMLIFSLNIIN